MYDCYLARIVCTGVSRSGTRFVARITFGGRKQNLGSFETEKEAGEWLGQEKQLSYDSVFWSSACHSTDWSIQRNEDYG